MAITPEKLTMTVWWAAELATPGPLLMRSAPLLIPRSGSAVASTTTLIWPPAVLRASRHAL